MSPHGRRRPRTSRGKRTVDRLLAAATTTFDDHGFHNASVAAICRDARVANGTFYQYFADKEQIYLELITRTSERLLAHLEKRVLSGSGTLQGIEGALRAYWCFIDENASLHQVLREAEFVRMDVARNFYRQLARCYRELIERGQRRGELAEIDPETLAFALIGLGEFVALRYLLWSREFSERVAETAEAFLAHGLQAGRVPSQVTVSCEDEHALSVERPLQSPARGTRAKILTAAEAEFGAQGFYRASVADIARRAGVAHGTVYTHFAGKEELFNEVVREINRQLRGRIRRATAGLADRLEVERRGFAEFFTFIGEHARAYRIVREAEFVGSVDAKGRAGRWYYERLAQGYVRGLRTAMAQDQIRTMDPEPLAWALMGIGHFLGLRWIVWEERLPPRPAREALDRLLRHGLRA